MSDFAERHGWRCHLCGGEVAPFYPRSVMASVDHLTPRSRGGTDELSNLALAHQGCNARRGNRPLQDVTPWPYGTLSPGPGQPFDSDEIEQLVAEALEARARYDEVNSVRRKAAARWRESVLALYDRLGPSEAADRLGISRERVHQIVREARKDRDS